MKEENKMEVKLVFSLGEGDAPILSEILAALAKGKITSPTNEESVEADAVHFEVIEESKPVKKTSKSKSKKVEVAGVDLADGKDVTVEEEVKVEPTKEEPEAVEEVKHATLEDIRSIARSLADSNRQKEYKPILEKYGYAKVNLIEEKDYDAIYAEMSELVGEDNA